MGNTADPQLMGVLSLFLALTWLSTGLRVYVRCFVSKCWGGDDFLLLAALFTFTAYVSGTLAGIQYGFGKHLTDVVEADIETGLMLWWLFELLYILTTVLLRCSIALFILRLCPKHIHRVIIYATTGFVITFSTFYFFLAIFQCTPVSYYWTRVGSGPPGTCINPAIFPAASYAHSAVSATADWVLGIMPIWLIWDLQMNFRTKLSVGVLLSCGMIAGVAAILRVPFILELANSLDFFYYIANVSICSTVEPGLGIVATAACVLRPLLKHFYGLTSYTTNQRRETNTHPSQWHSEHLSAVRSNGGIQRDKNGIEMERVVTSVLGNSKGEKGREWPMKSPAALQRGGLGNESEEELTAEGKGIVVHKTVEIRSEGALRLQIRRSSVSSIESEH